MKRTSVSEKVRNYLNSKELSFDQVKIIMDAVIYNEDIPDVIQRICDDITVGKLIYTADLTALDEAVIDILKDQERFIKEYNSYEGDNAIYVGSIKGDALVCQGLQEGW